MSPSGIVDIKRETLKQPFIYNKRFVLQTFEDSPQTVDTIDDIPRLTIFIERRTYEYKIINDLINLGLIHDN